MDRRAPDPNEPAVKRIRQPRTAALSYEYFPAIHAPAAAFFAHFVRFAGSLLPTSVRITP